jgi:hypothetical protein
MKRTIVGNLYYMVFKKRVYYTHPALRTPRRAL